MPPDSSAPDRGSPDFGEPLDWIRTSGHSEKLLAALATRERRRRRHRVLAASSLALLVLGGLAFLRPFPPAVSQATAPSQLVGPERRTLPDGTIAELRPGSELIVRFGAADAGPRVITLARGEAHFEVAHDSSRPFVVTAGVSRFRAVGTAFAVTLGDTAIEMLVTAGRVALDVPQPEHPASPVVEAGHLVRVDPASPSAIPIVTALTPAEIRDRLAWRVPRLEFNETPLAEVVALVHRHSSLRLRLIGRDIRKIEITGSLRVDNIEPLFHLLESHYGIRVSKLPGGEIGLESAR